MSNGSSAWELGPVGVTLRGVTSAAIGPASPVRIPQEGNQEVELVEYAVFMEVEFPTELEGKTARMIFTALFDAEPELGQSERLLHRCSVN